MDFKFGTSILKLNNGSDITTFIIKTDLPVRL